MVHWIVLLAAGLMQGACAVSASLAPESTRVEPAGAADSGVADADSGIADADSGIAPSAGDAAEPSVGPESDAAEPGVGPEGGGADPAPPPPPVDNPGTTCGASICEDGTNATGATCEQAITIGRATLLNSSAEYLNSTEGAGADQDLAQAGCKDEGSEVFYRVYLFAGEVLNLSVRNRAVGRDISVKVYLGADCAPPSGAVCFDNGAKNVSELVYQQAALGEGFHYIVIDGEEGGGTAFTISEAAPFEAGPNACSC